MIDWAYRYHYSISFHPAHPGQPANLKLEFLKGPHSGPIVDNFGRKYLRSDSYVSRKNGPSSILNSTTSLFSDRGQNENGSNARFYCSLSPHAKLRLLCNENLKCIF